MSRRTEKRRYGKYNKFDVVYADFGKNPHGIQGGIRPGIIISCDASNHDGAPQVSVVKGYPGTCNFKSEGCEWIWIK